MLVPFSTQILVYISLLSLYYIQEFRNSIFAQYEHCITKLRQIAKMLNARMPKIVSGPEVLTPYVCESEANIRNLFAEAEEEDKQVCFENVIVSYIL